MGKTGKGTGSRGLRNNKTHEMCRRCGRTSFHIQKRKCASCGFPAAKMRRYNWSQKALRRRTTGTGRMQYLGKIPRIAKNGFKSPAIKPKAPADPAPAKA